jgi:hypothetical protein
MLTARPEQQVIQRLMPRCPAYRDRHDLHAAVSGQALAEAAHHGLDSCVGNPEGEVTAPPAPSYRLVETPMDFSEPCSEPTWPPIRRTASRLKFSRIQWVASGALLRSL